MTKAEAIIVLQKIHDRCPSSYQREAVNAGIAALLRSIKSTKAAKRNHIARAKAARKAGD
ncbi:MAG: hypothetical protein ACI4Q3_00425 [Kiritimatiellia bacterium]